jgi:predicted TIM-barrel fold metal-dependent hydrolase
MTPAAPYLISADSHICEPGNLWLERTPKKFHDRVPKLVAREDTDIWVYGNGDTMSLAAFASAGDWKGRSTSNMREAELRPAIFDPVARIEEARADGVAAEVLYPSFAMPLYKLKDAELQVAVMRAYNDWLLEYCSAAPDKLLPHALIPTLDIDAAVAEIQRAARAGFRGVIINAHPLPERAYNLPLYDRLWAVLEESGLPASLHLYAGDMVRNPNDGLLISYSVEPWLVQRSLAQIIFAGVLERHPRLQFIVVESDVGWVAQLITRMDHVFLRKGPRYNHPLKSGMNPSEMFKRNIACVLTEDRAGVLTLEITGPDMFMWGSDYPHNDSTYPDSQQVVERVFGGVDAGTRNKILSGNASRLYGIKQAALAS